MKKLFFLSLWACCQLVQAGDQENMFRERVIIRKDVYHFGSQDVHLKYLNPNDTAYCSNEDGSMISGSINGNDVVFTQTTSAPDYGKGRFFRRDSLQLGNIKCDFLQKKQVLLLYPWKYTGSTSIDTIANTFFSTNTLCLKYGSRNNLSLPYRGAYFGLVTVPFKVFLASKTSLVDNYQFDLNLNFVLAYKIGKMKFSYIPGEEEGRSYIKAFSVGGLVGLNKVKLSKENIQDTTKSGDGKNILTGSIGGVIGYHYKKFSAFLSMGIDVPFSGTGNKQWIYRYRPWLGFGVGFELF